MADHSQRYIITVCQHRSCQRNGSAAVLAAFQEHRSAHLLVSGCECQGQCGSGPTVRVMPGDTWYCRVKLEDVSIIVDEHVNNGRPVDRLLHPRMHPSEGTYAGLAAHYQAFLPHPPQSPETQDNAAE